MAANDDKTGQFANAVDSPQSREVTQAVGLGATKPENSNTDFIIIVEHISEAIVKTYDKLEELSWLSNKIRHFNWPPLKMQELKYSIINDINVLQQQISRLQEMFDEHRTIKNGSYYDDVVRTLQSHLANVSMDFKQILEASADFI